MTQYNTEEEESIDVEFHDTATHHAIHVNNTQGHTMADLSPEAVLLASEADGDTPRSVKFTAISALLGLYKLLLVFSSVCVNSVFFILSSSQLAHCKTRSESLKLM